MDIRGLDLFRYIDYRQFLEDVFQGRKSNDRKYTFGKWSKELGMASVSGLTMILKGQRHPGPELIKKLIKNLELNKKEAHFFEALVLAKKNSKGDEETFKAIVQQRAQEVSRDERQVEFKWEMALIREMLKWEDFTKAKDLPSEKMVYQSHDGYDSIIKEMQKSKLISKDRKI